MSCTYMVGFESCCSFPPVAVTGDSEGRLRMEPMSSTREMPSCKAERSIFRDRIFQPGVQVKAATNKTPLLIAKLLRRVLFQCWQTFIRLLANITIPTSTSSSYILHILFPLHFLFLFIALTHSFDELLSSSSPSLLSACHFQLRPAETPPIPLEEVVFSQKIYKFFTPDKIIHASL